MIIASFGRLGALAATAETVTSGSVTVQAGEGPVQVAKRIWGDSLFWPYLLAANIEMSVSQARRIGESLARRKALVTPRGNRWDPGTVLAIPVSIGPGDLALAEAVIAGYCAAGTADAAATQRANACRLPPLTTPTPDPNRPPPRTRPAASPLGKAAVVWGIGAIALGTVAYWAIKR